MKKQHIEDAELMSINQSEEIYKVELEQVKAMRLQKLKKQKEQSELEYRKNTESINKSHGNQQARLKEQMEGEVITDRNLEQLQKRLNSGWMRSQLKKDEMKLMATQTLLNFDTVITTHERRDADATTERLLKFLDRKKKQLKHFQKFEEIRAEKYEYKKERHESKCGGAKSKAEDADAELARLGEEIQKKFEQHHERLEKFKVKREHEIILKHELEQLRVEDQQKNLNRQKKQIVKDKYLY